MAALPRPKSALAASNAGVDDSRVVRIQRPQSAAAAARRRPQSAAAPGRGKACRPHSAPLVAGSFNANMVAEALQPLALAMDKSTFLAAVARPLNRGTRPQSAASKAAEAMPPMELTMSKSTSRSQIHMDSAGSSGSVVHCASHYEFFAREIPASALGRPDASKHWRALLTKERRSLGRAAQLPQKSTGAWESPRQDEEVGVKRDSLATSSSTPAFPNLHRTSVTASHGESVPDCAFLARAREARARELEKVRDCVCEGFRVLVLGQIAPPDITLKSSALKASPEYHKNPPLKDETIKVYNFFRGLADGADPLPSSSDQEDELPSAAAVLSPAALWKKPSGGSIPGCLPLVDCSTFLSWSEDEVDLAIDARHKSIASALHRSLKAWKTSQATPSQRNSGISLVTMLHWTWPFAKRSETVAMLTWISHNELAKIAFPEPQVIQSAERRRLLSIFEEMDKRGGGLCTYKDIAGGDDLERDEVRNIVDPRTVRAVWQTWFPQCGDFDMGASAFLELMCENDYRGHEDATRVFLKDGRRLTYQERKIVGFTGWFLEEVPLSEVARRRLVDALEAEVYKWQRVAHKEANPCRIAPRSSMELSSKRSTESPDRRSSTGSLRDRCMHRKSL